MKFVAFFPITGIDSILGSKRRPKDAAIETNPQANDKLLSPRQKETADPIKPRATMSKPLSKIAAPASLSHDGFPSLRR